MANFNKIRKTFAESLIFTRALATLNPDSTGLYFPVDSGEPRFSAGGLAIESGSTNMLLHCRDMANGAWGTEGTIARSKNAIGIDGVANSATTLTDNDGIYNSYVRQIVTLSAVVQDCVASVYFGKTETAKYPAMSFEITAARSDDVMINSLTGAIHSATAGTTAVVESFGGFWRLSIMIRNTGANTFSAVTLHPALFSGASTGAIIADFAMIEQGRTKASSPIATTTATVARPNESAINAAFSTWGRQSIFTILVEFADFDAVDGGDMFALYKSGLDRIRITCNANSGIFSILSEMDTGGLKTRTFTATSAGKIAISVGSPGGEGVIKACNGVTLSDALTSATHNDITNLGLGRGQATTTPPKSVTISRIEFWPKAMTAAELQALTAL